MIKLNVGCASRPLKGYVNIDMDSLEVIKERYPNISFPEWVEIYDYDIFKLPYKNGEVDEVRADALVEHLSFKEEPLFFKEVYRVLNTDGIFKFQTPDFEDAVRTWLNAEDKWLDFYRDDDKAISEEHWFGNYSYSTENRWGYLMAMIFGPQNGEGQYHKNAYTEDKIRSMLTRLGYRKISIKRFRWKEERDLMLDIEAKK